MNICSSFNASTCSLFTFCESKYFHDNIVLQKYDKAYNNVISLTRGLTEEESHHALNKALDDRKVHDELCLGLLVSILADPSIASRVSTFFFMLLENVISVLWKLAGLFKYFVLKFSVLHFNNHRQHTSISLCQEKECLLHWHFVTPEEGVQIVFRTMDQTTTRYSTSLESKSICTIIMKGTNWRLLTTLSCNTW